MTPASGFDDVLAVAGASGTGKTSVGWEVSVQLRDAGLAHWHVEGDFLDSAWPRPRDDEVGSGLTRRSLEALASVFAGEGYKRCVYVQTAALLDLDMLQDVLRPTNRIRSILLTARTETRAERLAAREIGTALDQHIASSNAMADILAAHADGGAVRIETDDRSVADLAAEVITIAGWRTG